VRLGRLSLFAPLMGGLACTSGGGPAATPDGGTFVAFASDFKGFHDWPNQAEAEAAPTLPPFDAGASQFKVTWPLPGVGVSPVGTPGASGAGVAETSLG